MTAKPTRMPGEALQQLGPETRPHRDAVRIAERSCNLRGTSLSHKRRDLRRQGLSGRRPIMLAQFEVDFEDVDHLLAGQSAYSLASPPNGANACPNVSWGESPHGRRFGVGNQS